MRVEIPIFGQSYAHRHVELSSQTLKNWYPEINPGTSNPVSFMPWPGAVVFSNGVGNIDCGLHTFNGVLHKITDDALQRIDENGNTTGIQQIPGSGKASIISNDQYMVIVRSGVVYLWDGVTLTVGNDSDFETPRFVAYLNNQAIYTGQDSRFAVSNPGEPLNVNGLNYATAESAGDKLISVHVHNQQLYLFGEQTIEPWYNTGAGNPPFERIQSGIIQRGTLSGFSVSSNRSYTYFLGDDYAVYRMAGSQIEPVSTIPLTQSIKLYTNAEFSIGNCINWDSQNFYMLHFPNEATWCYSEAAGFWFELTQTENETPYIATSHARAYGKTFIADGSAVYQLVEDNYSKGNLVTLRERTSAAVSGAIFGPQYEGLPVHMGSVDIMMKVIPNATGIGKTPVVMLGYSDDHGRTWTERHLASGQLGQYVWRFRASQLGQFRERILRIRVSDPVKCHLLSVNGELELGV